MGDSTKPTSELALLEKNGTRCAQHQRVWSPEHETIRLDVALTVCSGPGILEDAQSAGADGAQSAHTAVADTSGIPYASDTDIAITLNGTAERVRIITFRAGPVLADVLLYYPGNDAAPTAAQLKLLDDTARAELAELPYRQAPDTTPSSASRLAASHAGSSRPCSASSPGSRCGASGPSAGTWPVAKGKSPGRPLAWRRSR